MKEIFAHPESYLKDHLGRVSLSCKSTINCKTLNFTGLPENVLQDLGFIAAVVHDMGKATENFQDYLFKRPFKNPGFEKKHHAPISAYLGYFLAEKYMSRYELEDEELQDLLPYFVYTTVKRHHGNLQNFQTELGLKTKAEEDFPKLIKNFHAEEITVIINEKIESLDLSFTWEEFNNFVINDDEFVEERGEYSFVYNMDSEDRNIKDGVRNYYLHQILYGSLLFSDKSDVILQNEINATEEINYSAVQDYRTDQKWNNPTDFINIEKNKAYQTTIDFVREKFDPAQHLYSVTMPTGLGKTVTSFAVALEMKRMLKNEQARIVITIPFTSIIDQNYEVYADILKNPTSGQLLKHHHLAEPKYNEKEDNVRDENESQFLIETWQSQVVVTTFVQLIECMFTADKGKLMKLPNLANAIIILDEVQNIKFELWEPIREVFKFLGEQMNCYFILMSATQPLIFDPKTEITELVPNYRNYFSIFERTQLINKTDTIVSLSEFTEIVSDYFADNETDDILIILNTVNETRTLFEELCKIIDEAAANIYYLSTRITPFERKEIIKLISEDKKTKKADRKRKPNIIVSTQLIEAGVDISVDTVFRVIAPIDSIIQAAGRANRYWIQQERSKVFIYKIEELEKSNKLIYGSLLMDKTNDVLKKYTEIDEENYLDLIEDYFTEIKKQADQSEDEILPAMNRLKFKDVGDFAFIPERKTESIFVQLNDKAAKVWKAYVKLAENKELKSYERRKEFAKYKAEFYDYVVNIPLPYENGIRQDHIAWDDEPKHFFYHWIYDKEQHRGSNKFYKYAESEDETVNYRENTGYFPTTPTF